MGTTIAAAPYDQEKPVHGETLLNVKLVPFLAILGVALIAWFIGPPDGLTIPAYRTAIIFISLIASIVANVLPTGAIAIIGIAFYAVLRAGGEETAAAAIATPVNSLSNLLIWMIVIAFMIARAFSKTGLGRRIALLLLSKFGKSTLHVAYCLGLADYIIAPVTPSNTARAAIVSPIADSLAKTINEKDSKLGKFFMSSCSAMNDASAVAFLTGFAGNLALLGIGISVLDIELTFASWLMYLLVPSLALLVIMPYILYKVINPETRETPQAQSFARAELKKMGATSFAEKKLLGVFAALLVMWIGGSSLGLHSTTAAMVGLSLLLLTGVLTWEDVKAEKGAWDTLIWFAVLMGMAGQLRTLGFTGWVGDNVSEMISAGVGDSSSTIVLLLMMTFYLFTAYFFASGTAKVVALAPVILGSLVSLGVTPMIALLAVAGITNIGCNLTTYSHARNPLLMGYGYHNANDWMKIGLIIAIAGAVIFMAVGFVWWAILGL